MKSQVPSLSSLDLVTGDVKETVRPGAARLDFNVEELESVTVDGPDSLSRRALMSPFVWQEAEGRFGIMLRAIPRVDEQTDTDQIWAGRTDDGRTFKIFDTPAIVGGPDTKDIGGVEDPTVVRTDDGYVVYYTGVSSDQTHGEMFYVSGPSPDRLIKSGVALASSKSLSNTKEAIVSRTKDDLWRLFYEYAADDACRVGLATGTGVDGPWEEQATPFIPREDGWDNWHLSTGPMLMDNVDCRVVDRCIQPLLAPPPVDDSTATDIAFAASVTTVGKDIRLYHSLEDSRLSRAQIRRH